MARGLKVWILKVDELYYLCSENKVLISFADTAKLICIFVFAYADCWISYDTARIHISNGECGDIVIKYRTPEKIVLDSLPTSPFTGVVSLITAPQITG